jgi:hypothetical protein
VRAPFPCKPRPPVDTPSSRLALRLPFRVATGTYFFAHRGSASPLGVVARTFFCSVRVVTFGGV